MIFEIVDLDSKLKTWADFVSKLQYPRFLMKFGTQNKLNMLIINILTGIDELDPKLQICEIWSQTEMCSNFYEIWHSQQVEHANYEYNTRKCLERLRDYWIRMIIGFVKFDSQSEHY